MEDKQSGRERGFAFAIFDYIVDKIVVQKYYATHGPNREVKTHMPSMKTQAVPVTFLVTGKVSFETTGAVCCITKRSWGRSGIFMCCGELLPWWRALGPGR